MNVLAEPVRFDARVDPETSEIGVTQSEDSALIGLALIGMAFGFLSRTRATA